MSTPTGSTTWQGATPLVGFGHMTSRSLVQPTTSSASQWPGVFGDSSLQPGGFGKKTSESESKKQTSETTKGVCVGGWGWGSACVCSCVFTQYFEEPHYVQSTYICDVYRLFHSMVVLYTLYMYVCVTVFLFAGASRPPPGFSTSHKEHLPMTDSVWGPAEQRPLGKPSCVSV